MTLPQRAPPSSALVSPTPVSPVLVSQAVPSDPASPAGPVLLAGRPMLVAIATTLVVLGACWTLVSVEGAAAALWSEIGQALWLLPALVGLHLGQLLLSALAWRELLHGKLPSVAAFWRLRLVREGIDSMLPVAQVGGEIVGARLLTARGVAPALSAASVVVDVTIELLAQVLFLAAGLVGLATLPGPDAAVGGTALGWIGAGGSTAAAARSWVWLLPVVGGTAALLVVAQRFGVLRGLELFAGAVARQFPGLAGDLVGLQAQALEIYTRRAALLRSTALHGMAWLLGTVETWAVLHALGLDVSTVQALVVESLGMAARSAGFALPAAIGVQEAGFILAVAAAGLPTAVHCVAGALLCAAPQDMLSLAPGLTGGAFGTGAVAVGLSLSLVKRLREMGTGLLGLALWRWPH